MPFTNPIVAGTKLVREAIESPNYDPGVLGWSINKDGTAEFNDLTVRGEFTNTGPTSTARLVDGHFLVFTNDPDDDSFALLEPNRVQLQETDGGQALILLDTADGNLGVLAGSALEGFVVNGTNGFIYKTLDGFAVRDWVNCTVNSGTAVNGNEPQSKLMPDGTVIMRGSMTGHSTIANTVILTLPVSHRPARAGRWGGLGTNSTNDNNIVQINTDGTVQIVKAAVSQSWFTGVQLSTI